MKPSVLAVTILFFALTNCYGRDANAELTSVEQLSSFEKLLLRLHNPQLAKRILDSNDGNESQKRDESVLSYEGSLEVIHVELPTIFLQLVKFGRNVRLPSFHHEFSFYYCYMGICIGINQVYDWRDPIITTGVEAEIKTSLNGTRLHLEFSMPDLQIHSPEFTFDDEDVVAGERTIWRGITYFIRNYTLTFTGEFTIGPDGLKLSDSEIDWNLDDFRYQYHNGTHTFSDGRTEEWGPVDQQYAEDLMDTWMEMKEFGVVKEMEEWINCFLTNGKSDQDTCENFLNDNLHVQTFAQILHSFGLAALNSERNKD